MAQEYEHQIPINVFSFLQFEFDSIWIFYAY